MKRSGWRRTVVAHGRTASGGRWPKWPLTVEKFKIHWPLENVLVGVAALSCREEIPRTSFKARPQVSSLTFTMASGKACLTNARV